MTHFGNGNVVAVLLNVKPIRRKEIQRIVDNKERQLKTTHSFLPWMPNFHADRVFIDKRKCIHWTGQERSTTTTTK